MIGPSIASALKCALAQRGNDGRAGIAQLDCGRAMAAVGAGRPCGACAARPRAAAGFFAALLTAWMISGYAAQRQKVTREPVLDPVVVRIFVHFVAPMSD